MVSGKCAYCGKNTTAKYKSHLRKYCSHKCANMASAPDREKKIEFECQVCSKKFKVVQSDHRILSGKQIKYCSHKCSGIAIRKEGVHTKVVCSQCGKIFSKRTDFLQERNYCSRTCQWESRKKYGTMWGCAPDKERVREYHRKYTENNRERINAISRIRQRKNRKYKNYIQQIRRASGTLTRDQWNELVESGKKCVFCGSTEQLQVDHIVPVAKGGKTEFGNLQILCASCNQSKGTREAPGEWRRSADGQR